MNIALRSEDYRPPHSSDPGKKSSSEFGLDDIGYYDSVIDYKDLFYDMGVEPGVGSGGIGWLSWHSGA
jgi:hypothetical protein